MPDEIDLRTAINAISDVVQNRPRSLRDFDQIYMKAGDMVLQSELVARWADGRRLAFIGDGDAISVCVAYLHARKILSFGPSQITVFDFDERICLAVERFADAERIDNLFVSLTESLDFSTPSGRAMAGMLSTFAEFERDIIRERVKAGIANSRAKGRPHGRPRTASLKRAQIEKLKSDGLNHTQIARKLKISRASVINQLNREPPEAESRLSV